MAEIPRAVDQRVRRAIAALEVPWHIVKKRDHYFLHIEGRPMICISGNRSKEKEHLVKLALKTLEKARG